MTSLFQISKKGGKRIINFDRSGISTARLQFYKINQWKHLFPPSFFRLVTCVDNSSPY